MYCGNTIWEGFYDDDDDYFIKQLNKVTTEIRNVILW